MASITFLKEGKTATITLSRPEALNAINMEMALELGKAVEALSKDKGIRFVIFAGNEKTFSAGADIKMFSQGSIKQISQFASAVNKLFDKIENMEKVTIAAISGFCLGGGNELAIACDFRIAGKSAKFAQPEVKIGLIPGAGAIRRLAKLIGINKTKELVYTGKTIDATAAKEMGLVNEIALNPLERARELSGEMASVGFNAIIKAKKLLQKEKITQKNEIGGFLSCFGAYEQKEGMNAFLEKRKPEFT